MKISKKAILLTIVFIVFFFIAYFLVMTFHSSSLTFKPYFYSQGQQQNEQYNYKYRLNEDNQVIYSYQKNNEIFINKIVDDNGLSQNIIHFDFKYGNDYTFICLTNQIILHSSMQQMLYVINVDSKQISFYDDLIIKEKLIINHFTQDIYFLSTDELYKLSEQELIKMVDLDILNIKNADFIDEKQLMITTYDSEVFSYNLKTKELIKHNFLVQDYIINEQNFYGIYKDSTKLNITIYNQNEIKTFSVKDIYYRYLKVCDDYLYLIFKNEISKINIKRQKFIEKCDVGKYVEMEYDLKDLLIVHEKLMYLPMIKTTTNYEDNQEKTIQSSYLYRYAK